MKNAHVIYHRKDLDGFCSGAIARMWAEQEGYKANMIGWDYNDPRLPDELIENEDLKIIVDLSLPVDQMRQLAPCNIWIDHHRSAIKDSQDHEYTGYNGYRKEGDSASLLAWQYFFGAFGETGNAATIIPSVVYWVDRYDVWKQDVGDGISFDRVVEIQNMLRVYFEDPEDEFAFNHWKLFFDANEKLDPLEVYKSETELINKIIKDGEERIAKNHFVIPSWEGYSWTALNAGGGSKVLKSVDTSKTDGIMMFTFNGKRWVFSLYGEKGFDFSIIAKAYGGGGHAGACGFSMSNDQFVGFLNDYLI